jgi:hypothetical protein
VIALLLVWSVLVVVGYATHKIMFTLGEKWAAERLDGRRFADSRDKIAREDLSLREREVVLKERVLEKPPKAASMPEDLRRRILAWEDTFAQEDEARTLAELYAEYGDWDTVRQKVLPMSMVATPDPSDRSMVQ